MPAWPGVLGGSCPNKVAPLLAHGTAQFPLENRIGCGEWLGQIPQIVSLTELMTTTGQRRGSGRHYTRLLVPEHGQNRPLQVPQGREERRKRGLIELRQP